MTAGDGILCPVCSGHTGVSNTKPGVGEIRRYRRCLDRDCSGRLWTVELAVGAPPPDMVLVPRKMLRRLQNVVRAICFPSPARESACASPDDAAIPVIE